MGERLGLTTALVVPVRSGPNEELRYALRSACANIQHDALWIVGDGPEWLRPTGRLTSRPAPSKWRRLRAIFQAVAEARCLPTQLVWMDDDVFLMQPWSGIACHLGDAPTNPAAWSHTNGLRETATLLRQIGAPRPYRNFEVHAPMPMHHGQIQAAMRLSRDFEAQCLHPRTLYGNLFNVRAYHVRDFKIRDAGADLDRPILSTSDRGFTALPVGEHVRAAFPEPCRWEAP